MSFRFHFYVAVSISDIAPFTYLEGPPVKSSLY